jgi:hypothetical protein
MKNKKLSFEKLLDFFQVVPKKDLLVVLAGILMGTWFGWDIMEILLFALLIVAVLKGFSSRIMILPAILFLCLVIILLALDRSAQAEEFSIYTYYFMGISLILALIESWRGEIRQ